MSFQDAETHRFDRSEETDSRHFLITGGAGFLGINLARFLLKKGHQVTSLDLMEFDYPDVRDRVCAITGDTRDMAAVLHCRASGRRTCNGTFEPAGAECGIDRI